MLPFTLPQLQNPPWQVSLRAHLFPQPLQFSGSLRTFLQVPPQQACCPLHTLVPAHLQTPFTQLSPDLHTTPQPPQWFASFVMFAQAFGGPQQRNVGPGQAALPPQVHEVPMQSFPCATQLGAHVVCTQLPP